MARAAFAARRIRRTRRARRSPRAKTTRDEAALRAALTLQRRGNANAAPVQRPQARRQALYTWPERRDRGADGSR